MKTIPKSDMWPVFAALRPGKQVTSDKIKGETRKADSCHVSRFTFHASAFTIVELLVVIAIIAILAALLLPVLSRAKVTAQKRQAAIEISQIVGGIQQYDSVYGRFPVSTATQQAAQAGNNGNFDFTYGGVFQTPAVPMNVGTPVSGSILTNSEVIAILMNFTNYPNNPSQFTANINYQKNPQQTIFLNAKMSGYDPSQLGAPLPGVGNDLVYRDPWGNPYVISMDLNYDEQCQDAFYCLDKVSGPAGANTNPGLNGLINPDTTQNNNFRYHGKVMVWSAGPDGKIDPTAPASGYKSGVNKDNILSWQ